MALIKPQFRMRQHVDIQLFPTYVYFVTFFGAERLAVARTDGGG